MSEEAKLLTIDVDEAREQFKASLKMVSAWNAIAMILGDLDHEQRRRVTKAMSLMVEGYAKKEPGQPLDREVTRAVAEALTGRPPTEAELAEFVDDDDDEADEYVDGGRGRGPKRDDEGPPPTEGSTP